MASFEDLLADGIPLAHLKIGECIVSARPLVVSTVLGSCVAATLFHPGLKAGAICHAMLPERRCGLGPGPPCRFVDSALELLLERMERLGAPRRELECKLFGGGFTIAPQRRETCATMVDVGRMNVEVARRELERLKLRPLAEDVLGERGRKLFFATHTGEVWQRYVGRAVLQAEGEA